VESKANILEIAVPNWLDRIESAARYSTGKQQQQKPRLLNAGASH